MFHYNKEENVMFRKAKSNCTVGTFEKTRGLPTGSIRHENGRKVRKDKTIGALRKEKGFKFI